MFIVSHLAPWLNLSFLQIAQLGSLDFSSRNPVFEGLLIVVQDLSQGKWISQQLYQEALAIANE